MTSSGAGSTPELPIRRSSSALGLVAGGFAVASGCAYIAYLLVGIQFRDTSIAAWNILIIPTALSLGVRLAAHGALVSAASAAAGVAASWLWAFGHDVPELEPWWIGLAAAWWLGLGWQLRTERPTLGLFTVLLGVSATVDFILTALNAPTPIYALGGFKIPLTIVWSLWLGVALLRYPRLGAPQGRDARAAM